MRNRTLFIILSPLIIIILGLVLVIGILQSMGVMTLNYAASLVEIGVSSEIALFAQDVTALINRLNFPLRFLFIPTIFIIAFIFHRLNYQIAKWLIESPLIHMVRRPYIVLDSEPLSKRIHEIDPEKSRHRQTLIHLVASAISMIAFFLAFFLSLLQFINSAGLAIITTVVSTAVGFGARDYINDLIMGMTDIFEDDFNVGEKIEILRVLTHIEGVVKKVNIRTATIQTPDGIPIIIPHGELRVIRNFSRGNYSSTYISFSVETSQFSEKLDELQQLSDESMTLFPQLIEPLKIISKSGVMGSKTELNILGKANFGHGAGLRLALLSEIDKRFQT